MENIILGGEEETVSADDKKFFEGLQEEGFELSTPKQVSPEEAPAKETPEVKQEIQIKEPEVISKQEELKEEPPIKKRSWPEKILEKKEEEWKTKEAQYLSTIEAMKVTPVSDTQQKPKINESREEMLKQIAEKHGLDIEVVKDLDSVFYQKQEIPPEFQEKLSYVDKLREEYEGSLEKRLFEDDFEKRVAPLVRDEYPEISDSDLQNIKNTVKKIAYTEEFAKTPLDYIYRGEPSLRGVVRSTKKTAESSRKGDSKTEMIDYNSLSGEQISNLTGKEFFEYSEWMEKNNPK